MASTFTPALALEIPAHGDYASTGWDNPMDNSLRALDTAYGGMLTLSVTGGTTNLSTTQASNPVIYVTGTLSGNQVITFPNTVAGRRIILPGCVMGSFALFIRGGGGSDPIGVYFWNGFGIPYGIVVTPTRVYWDYSGSDVANIIDKPVGFAGNGFLPCDGRYVGMQQHDLLWDVIGGTYGVSGTYPTGSFKLPDYRGVVLAMADQIGLVPGAGPFAQNTGNRGILNSWGINTFAGEANHTLSIAEMPSHNHPGTYDSGHGHTASQDAHTHTVGNAIITSGGGLTPGGAAFSLGNATTSGASANNVYIGTGAAQIVVAAQGGSGSHNNIQPTMTTMKLIKW